MNLGEIRKEFPVTENLIYFNHAGTAPIPLRVKESIDIFTEEFCKYGNFRQEKWSKKVEEVREKFASLINASTHEVAFVKNTSEGLSIVASDFLWNSGENVIITDMEFPANVYPWMNLRRRGVETRFVKASQGRIKIQDIEEAMDKNTRLLSISSVEYSNGFRNDLELLGSLCTKKGVLFCVDAIQSLGVLEMDVKRYNIDFLAAGGHKWLLCIEGIGGFYCSERTLDLLHPSKVGWKSVVNWQDYSHYDLSLRSDASKFEEGTQNLVGILALGVSLDMLLQIGIRKIEERVGGLTDMIIEGLQGKGYKILSSLDRGERSGIVSFKGKKDSAEIHSLLMERGIISALRMGAVRVSPHFYNSEEEVEQFLRQLP